mgnify:CR=1 FL=1
MSKKIAKSKVRVGNSKKSFWGKLSSPAKFIVFIVAAAILSTAGYFGYSEYLARTNPNMDLAKKAKAAGQNGWGLLANQNNEYATYTCIVTQGNYTRGVVVAFIKEKSQPNAEAYMEIQDAAGNVVGNTQWSDQWFGGEIMAMKSLSYSPGDILNAGSVYTTAQASVNLNYVPECTDSTLRSARFP